VAIELMVNRGVNVVYPDGVMPSGQVSRQVEFDRFGVQLRPGRSTAAMAELPVASIRSTTTMSRSLHVVRHLEVILHRRQRFSGPVRMTWPARAGTTLSMPAFQNAVASAVSLNTSFCRQSPWRW
jgi:hypothetical protein